MEWTMNLFIGVSAIFAVRAIWGLWRFGKLTTLDIRMLLNTYMAIVGLILGGSLLINLFSN